MERSLTRIAVPVLPGRVPGAKRSARNAGFRFDNPDQPGRGDENGPPYTEAARAAKPGAGMAERAVEDIEIINQRLIDHAKWLRGKGGSRADLSFEDLSHLSLRKVCLRQAVLVGANLIQCDLSEADLTHAELFGADLECADLSHADLTGADFRGANLHKAILAGTILRGADLRSDRVSVRQGLGKGGDPQQGQTRLTEARLDRAVLCEANLSGCDFSGADMQEADLSGADLSRACFMGADLSGAALTKAKLDGTVIEVERLDANQRIQLGKNVAKLTEPTFELVADHKVRQMVHAHEAWIMSEGAKGARLDLTMCRLESKALAGVDLSGARLRRCCLALMDLTGTRLDMADLAYADLRGAIMEEASLSGTNLRRANLSRAQAAAASFVPMQMVGDRTWPTNLEGALLIDADLTNAVFTNAILKNADMGGSILTGTSLRGVDLGSVKRSTPVPGADGPGPRELRKTRRFTAPVLHARTDHGTFRTLDWSFSGLGLDWRSPSVLKPGDELFLVLSHNDGNLPPIPITGIVRAFVPESRRLGLSYKSLEPVMKDFFNSLVPAKYRKR